MSPDYKRIVQIPYWMHILSIAYRMLDSDEMVEIVVAVVGYWEHVLDKISDAFTL